MLSLKPEIDEARVTQDCLPCTVCLREVENASTFETIPLRKRIEEWVLSNDTSVLLFSTERTPCDQPSPTYIDYYDGRVYKNLVKKRGGDEKAKYDIFLDISADGFNVFQTSAYDCWPIILMVLNLPLNCRFLMRNALPYGFIKGPKEPKRLDTYLLPLIQEINEINSRNSGDGMTFRFSDGTLRNVKVHLLWCKGDGPAFQKISGYIGARGKRMCRFCNIDGYLCQTYRTYYFPFRVRVSELDSENVSRVRLRRLYSPTRLPLRQECEVRKVWERLGNGLLSKTAKRTISRDTGIRARTCIDDLDMISPICSLPLDIMHMELNLVCSTLLPLWKGDERNYTISSDAPAEFIVSNESWQLIDEEFTRARNGTCEAFFGRSIRNTQSYKTWKAEECRLFTCYYTPVLLQGHMGRRYMKGVRFISDLYDLISRPVLSLYDVGEIQRLAVGFFEHFESDYFQFDEERIHLCRSTIHAFLHLADNVRLFGPPLIYSQFFFGWSATLDMSSTNFRPPTARQSL